MFAASATIKGKTLAQAEQELIEILNSKIMSGKQAKDLMSSPPITVEPDVSCKEVRDILTRYNINSILVSKKMDGKDKLFGFITRQVVAKTQYLKLDNASVREYMNPEIRHIRPDSGMSEIQKKIIEYKQRILPVMQNGIILGVVTRNDLLSSLAGKLLNGQKLPDPDTDDMNARVRNVVRLMQERLPQRLLDILADIGKAAEELGYGVYVVGGFVRDLFLNRENQDIDIVIEGKGIVFAKKYAAMAGARINAYEKFGTTVIIFPDKFKIDVASARMEHYRFPADMPIVEMSSIKLYLFRRDFTVNTLSIQLNPERFGTLIDFFSAQKDIKEKAIRILHNLSFVEDPTRVFRAIRFEQRFGFTIGKLTSGLIKNVVKMDLFRQLSGRRVFSELRQILEEDNPVQAVKRLHDFDLLIMIHPSLKPDKNLVASFNSVKKVMNWHDLLFLEETYDRWLVYFNSMIARFNKSETEEICDKLELAHWIRRRIRALIWKQWKNRRTRIRNLLKLGIYRRHALTTGCARKGIWRMSRVKWYK